MEKAAYALDFYTSPGVYVVVHLDSRGNYVDGFISKHQLNMTEQNKIKPNQILVSKVAIPERITENGEYVTSYSAMGMVTFDDEIDLQGHIDEMREDGTWNVFLEEVLGEYEKGEQPSTD